MKRNLNMWKLLILLSVLFSSCSGGKKVDLLEKGLPYVVNLEQCLAMERDMKISDIADTVEYIELKTPKDLFITRVWNIIPIDDFWIIHSRDGVYKFTNKGEYVETIGCRGQGPGEYSTIYNIDVDCIGKEIVINTSGQLLFYDLDGNYLRGEKKKGTYYDIGISDSILWVSETGTNVEKYIAFAMNFRREILDSILNPFYGVQSQDAGTGLHLAKLFKPFYRHKDTLYLKGKELNDTIFQLAGLNRKPYVVFDMGKYKLPIEYEAWYSFEAAQKHGARYWGIPAIAEDDRYLFLLAQRYAPVDGKMHVHNDENFKYIIYDKEKKKGFVVKGEKNIQFRDNILGGPSIWPYWITDDYYMNVIEWYNLSEELRRGKYKLSPVFQKQIAGFGNDTNPLVILCRRQK